MKTCAKCGDQFEWVDRAGHRSYCKPCFAQYQREWRAKNPGATAEAKRKFRQAHPERVREAKRAAYQRNPEPTRAAQRRLRAANPDRTAQHNAKARQRIQDGVGYGYYKYGLTRDEKAAILAAQGGACAICQKPLDEVKQCVDHDHGCCPKRDRRTCGKCVRGVLCSPCNFRLGWYEKHAERLAGYLAAPRYETAPPTGRWKR